MTPKEYNEALKIIAKAEDALLSAQHDLKGGFLLATANRTYYACFYCMTALLHTKNAYAKTHQGVRAKFSEMFIKTSVFPTSVSDDIALIFKYRQEADYDFDAEISGDEAVDLIGKAKYVLQLTKEHFQQFMEE